jgi:hypothetical protein
MLSLQVMLHCPCLIPLPLPLLLFLLLLLLLHLLLLCCCFYTCCISSSRFALSPECLRDVPPAAAAAAAATGQFALGFKAEAECLRPLTVTMHIHEVHC